MMVVKPEQAETAEVWAEAIVESLERTKDGLMSFVGKQQVECRTRSNGPSYYLTEVS